MKPKQTSFEYGKQYQLAQAEKFRNRENNHWKHRIELANTLVHQAIKNMPTHRATSLSLLDVGCSVGTFAIEFAKKGFRCYGVDFDQQALEIASGIAASEGVSPTFICGDVSQEIAQLPPIDIAVCFDVFEHLHDDELGGLLTGIKRHMSDNGVMIFHTFPTQEDHLFHGKLIISAMLLPFIWLPKKYFYHLARSFSCAIDGYLALVKGKTYRQIIKSNSHCNPLSLERLSDIFRRAGWVILEIRTANLYPSRSGRSSWFRKHSIADRNLFGIARPANRRV